MRHRSVLQFQINISELALYSPAKHHLEWVSFLVSLESDAQQHSFHALLSLKKRDKSWLFFRVHCKPYKWGFRMPA